MPLRPSQIPQQPISFRKWSNTRAPTSGLFIMTAGLNMAAYNTGSCVILNVTLDFLVAAWGKSVVNRFNHNKAKGKGMTVFKFHAIQRMEEWIPGIHWVGGWVSLFGWRKRKIGLMESRKQRIDTQRLGIRLFSTVPSADVLKNTVTYQNGREKVKVH